MCFQNITYKEIIGNVINNGDDHRSKAINYLRGFIKYLKEETDLAEIAIKIYINRLLKNFFNKGAMNDLLGDINLFIREYSKGGTYYDQRDHNNTLAALKKMRDYHYLGKLPKYINISKSSGWQSFASNHSDHVVFTLENNMILVPKKKKMRDFDYYELLILIAKNTNYLSAGSNPFSTIHGPIGYINYTIGKSMYDPDALRGYSNKLFDSQNEEEKPYVDALNNKFRNIISKYYP